MTLGQRIQEGRKALGLSQEGLGEKLGVSRQAISKWEADGAVPELDKLIALSRLFQVNIGVLLGVEVPPAEGGDNSLNEGTLAAVEAVAARCAPRRWVAAAGILCAVVLGISLVGNLLLSREVARVRQETDRRLVALQGQISSVQISYPQPPVEDEFLAAKVCAVETVDVDAGTVTLRLSATPKRYVAGMTAEFTAMGQGVAPVSQEVETPQGQTFATLITCPLNDEIVITVALKDASATETRTLDTIYDLKRDSGIALEAWWEEAGTVAIKVFVGKNAPAFPAEGFLRSTKDGFTVQDYPIELHREISEGAPAPVASGETTYFIYPEGQTDGVEFTFYLKDSDGREYTVPVMYRAQ